MKFDTRMYAHVLKIFKEEFMQTIGHIIDNRTGEKILVLVRIGKRIDKFCHVINIKKRNGGTDGNLIAENDYLNNDTSLIDKLKNNEVVYC